MGKYFCMQIKRLLRLLLPVRFKRVFIWVHQSESARFVNRDHGCFEITAFVFHHEVNHGSAASAAEAVPAAGLRVDLQGRVPLSVKRARHHAALRVIAVQLQDLIHRDPVTDLLGCLSDVYRSSLPK